LENGGQKILLSDFSFYLLRKKYLNCRNLLQHFSVSSVSKVYNNQQKGGLLMDKSLLRKMSLGLLTVMFVVWGGFGFPNGVANASGNSEIAALAAPQGALTAAPPVEPMSVFNPNHLYLDNGTSSISASSGKVTVSATTTASQIVDSIGITFYVQKWNGSVWEVVGSGTTTGGNQLITYSNTVPKSVTAGYYYRARTIHWVIENGVYEEGERFSNTVLGQ
jgi:hypothetical protein